MLFIKYRGIDITSKKCIQENKNSLRTGDPENSGFKSIQLSKLVARTAIDEKKRTSESTAVRLSYALRIGAGILKSRSSAV